MVAASGPLNRSISSSGISFRAILYRAVPAWKNGGAVESPRVAVVIEDDEDIRGLLCAVLQQSGFEVHETGTGAAGVEAVRRHRPSIITLDLGLPDIDGFEVARRVRLFSDSYIIMLTARAEELDTLMGLEAGADDYITKPFRPRELRARIAAMLRRPRHGEAAGGPPLAAPGRSTTTGPHAAGPVRPTEPGAHERGAHERGAEERGAEERGAEERGAYEHNGLMLNPATRFTEVAGTPVDLTRTEFDLLHALLASGRRVRTKADLVRGLRNEDYDSGTFISEADERAIEVHLGNVRRKIGDDARSPRWLVTVRGVGYRLAPRLPAGAAGPGGPRDRR